MNCIKRLFVSTLALIPLLMVARSANMVGLDPSILIVPEEAQVGTFPGQKTDFHGFDRYKFKTQGVPVSVICPKVPAKGKPWLWRSLFWDTIKQFNQADLKLVEQGYHVVLVHGDVSGHPRGNKNIDAAYELLTQEYGFAKTCSMASISRGTLSLFRWATENPEKVNSIYVDNGVCNVLSWPAGYNVPGNDSTSNGDLGSWNEFKKKFGYATDEEALLTKESPIDLLEPLAKAGVPILMVCGSQDTAVPYEENDAIMEQRYKALGGDITVIIEDKGHSHGMKDPAPVLEFIRKHSAGAVDLEQVRVPQLVETKEEEAARVQWFRDAKFGLFIHWGPAALSGAEISWGMKARIEGGAQHQKVPRHEYMNLYQNFNPVKFNPDEIMALAKDAGMTYSVFVTKHHDGFSLWDTKQQHFPEGADFPVHYSIADTPYQKDVVGMVRDAALKNDMKIGWYYSTRDWTHPDYLKGDNVAYNDYYENQVEELLLDYGPVDMLWFDHCFGNWDQYTIPALYQKMYAIAPDLLVNNRAARGLKDIPSEYVSLCQNYGQL